MLAFFFSYAENVLRDQNVAYSDCVHSKIVPTVCLEISSYKKINININDDSTEMNTIWYNVANTEKNVLK